VRCPVKPQFKDNIEVGRESRLELGKLYKEKAPSPVMPQFMDETNTESDLSYHSGQIIACIPKLQMHH
jgi:hypothetical protein